ncbi:helicase loader [Bacillus phage 031MP004]|nr:helicase loader [Bacillus phage 031MP003]QFG05554.1 helicase loader [Bacillus phage 031MP002]QFG05641.1 helicase loader [Bacillus phage 031MP004]
MTFKEAVKIIQQITVYYQNFTITEEKVKQWAHIIQEYEIKQVEENLAEYARYNKFPPTLADLIRSEKDEQPKGAAYIQVTPELMQLNAQQAEELLKRLQAERKVVGKPELPDFIKNRGRKN